MMGIGGLQHCKYDQVVATQLAHLWLTGSG